MKFPNYLKNEEIRCTRSEKVREVANILCHLQHHLDALVFGTVVHKDIFHILVSLFKERAGTLGNVLLSPIYGHTD